MTNEELRLHLVEALEEMKKKALDMKIRGVEFIKSRLK